MLATPLGPGGGLFRRARRLLRWRVLALLAFALTALLVYRCLQPPDAMRSPSSTERSVLAPAGAWAIVGGDAGGTRSLVGAPSLESPELAWEVQLESHVVAPLVTDGETLLVALADSRLLAFSTADGSSRWSVAIPGQLDHAPTIAGDAAYIGLRGGAISALDLATGTERWSHASGRTFATSPVVVDGVAWAGAQGQLLALDAETGEQLAERGLGPLHAAGRPAVGARLVAIATRHGEVQRGAWFAREPGVAVFDEVTGRERFRAPVANARHVAVGSGAVVVVSDRALIVFDPSARSPWWEGVRNVWAQLRLWGFAPSPPGPPFRWASRTPCEPLAPAVERTRVILACPNGEVRAYALVDGALMWERSGSELAQAPIVSDAGVLLVERRAARLIDTTDGRERARVPLGALAPIEQVLATDRGQYVVTAGNRLLAVR